MTDVSDREHLLGPSRTVPGGEGARANETTRSGFLGFVAHEMRNPLATALWSAELLARLSPEERGGARGEKLAGMALRALQRLRYLVEDHFLAERLDVEGIPVRIEPIGVRELLAGAVQKAAVEDASLDVQDGLVARGDRMLLERALEGILSSAARAKAPVRVEARRHDGMVLIRAQGAAPAPDALAPPQKGTPSDATGRALALHMAVRAARALGGSLAVAEDAYVLAVPLGEPEPPDAG